MDGVASNRGQHRIFILEGILTVFVGRACFFCSPNFPEVSTRWLKTDEIHYLETHEHADQVCSVPSPGVVEKRGFPWRILRNVFLDWQIYLTVVIYWSNALPNYTVKLNMPAVIKSMGYTIANAQLLSNPPCAVGVLSAFVLSRVADRLKWRMLFIVLGQVILTISFATLYAYGYAPEK